MPIGPTSLFGQNLNGSVLDRVAPSLMTVERPARYVLPCQSLEAPIVHYDVTGPALGRGVQHSAVHSLSLHALSFVATSC